MVTEHTVPYLSVEHRALSFVHSLMQDKPFHPGGAAALDSMASYAAKHGALDPQKSTDIGDYNGLRADRWRQRRTVRRVLKGTRVASCGRPVSKETGVGLYYDAKHGSRFSGLRSCGSVWACPVCNHKIQSSRLDDVTAVMEHCKEHGWGVVFGTLTVRHKRKDTLKEVVNMAREVWRKSRSHRRIKDLFSRTHEIGYIRAQEITYSHANGWHVHFHCYYIFDHELTKSEAADFAGSYAAEWVETARRCGYAAPMAKNQKFEVIDLHKVSSMQAAARYCTIKKTAVTPQTSKLGHEMTDTQAKIGKVKVHGNGKQVLHLSFWDFVRILTDEHNVFDRTLSAIQMYHWNQTFPRDIRSGSAIPGKRLCSDSSACITSHGSVRRCSFPARNTMRALCIGQWHGTRMMNRRMNSVGEILDDRVVQFVDMVDDAICAVFGQLARFRVAPAASKAVEIAGLGPIGIRPAIADHQRTVGSAIESDMVEAVFDDLFLEQARIVLGRSVNAVHHPRDTESIADRHGLIFGLAGGHGQVVPVCAQRCKLLRNTVEHHIDITSGNLASGIVRIVEDLPFAVELTIQVDAMVQLIVGNMIALQRSDDGRTDKTLQFRRIRHRHMQGLERLLDAGENTWR